MDFASIDVYRHLISLGFKNLPNEKYWNKKNQTALAKAIIDYLSDNLNNSEIWSKFEFILSSIFYDNDFTEIFTDELSLYLGSEKFSKSLISRAKSGELIWSQDCIILINRMEELHKNFLNKEFKSE